MGLDAMMDLGGYGAYIWPCYGLAALILGGLTVHAIRRYYAAKHRLAALEAEER